MEIKVGIVGLPNVGKSTLFNAITNLNIEAANYPFATIEPNIGVVEIRDERVNRLAQIYNTKKIIFNQIKFYDIAGLVKGASKGEGLGNQFLNNIRDVDAILHVVRIFKEKDIIHVDGNIDPIRDIETINTELILSDIEQATRWLDKNEKKILTMNENKDKLNLMLEIKKRLYDEKKLNEFEYSNEDLAFLNGFQFLTLKPMVYLLNVSDSDIANLDSNEDYLKVKNYILKNNDLFVSASIQIEYEISKLNEEDQKSFLNELGLSETRLNLISKKIFDKLNLATYFTAGKEEVHAWPFRKGITSPEAAGIIHSDFEKGFIKVEVFTYDDINKYESEQVLKDKGLVKLEGKTYEVKDGDVCHFRFNV